MVDIISRKRLSDGIEYLLFLYITKSPYISYYKEKRKSPYAVMEISIKASY
jgi:hypothetical protein